MKFYWNAEQWPDALLLMLLGMVGIFVVMLVIMGVVYLLNRFAKDKPKDEPDARKPAANDTA